MKIFTRILLLAAFVASGFYLQNCGTSTRVLGSWKNPDTAGKKYSKVFIVGLTSNIVARKSVEDELASALNSIKETTATSSMTLFPPNYMQSKPDKEEVLSKIREEGYDAVVTVALVDEREETRYVPGSTMYAPVSSFGYYGTFGGYYSTMYPTYYDPGYYTTDKTYVVETNVYDAATEDLIWSAQSETYDPSNPGAGFRSLTGAVVDRMERDGVF